MAVVRSNDVQGAAVVSGGTGQGHMVTLAEALRKPDAPALSEPTGSVSIMSRADLMQCPAWTRAFADQRKDHRYYEIVEDTIPQDFEYSYFAIKGDDGDVRAIQPFFIHKQDLLDGTHARIRAIADRIRRLWPGFLRMRTLMVGCTAGEAHLDGADDSERHENARILSEAIGAHARALKVSLVVLKEFPAQYRPALTCFVERGFARAPSAPTVLLDIEHRSFDEYARSTLTRDMRYELRRKFRKAAEQAPIQMTVHNDLRPFVDEIYRLYLNVYERSKMRFEKLTKPYFCELGRRMPDKVRLFLWRQDGRLVGFSLCMVQSTTMSFEYIGLDYSIALQLHLYFIFMRDMIVWSMEQKLTRIYAGQLNYDAKHRFRFKLGALDLYVWHRSSIINWAMSKALPYMVPVRSDPMLRRFANYNDIW